MKVYAVSIMTLQHDVRGGMERYFDFVVRGLANLGHSVTLVTTRMDTKPDSDSLIQFRSLPVATGSRGRDWTRELRQSFECLPHSPDIIISNSFAASPLIGFPSPIVPIIHGSGLVDLISSFRLLRVGHESPLTIPKEIVRVVKDSFSSQRKLMRSCRQIVAVSEQTKKSVSKTYGVPLSKIQVIGGPVDTDQFRPAATVAPVVPTVGRPLRVFSAGTVWRQKGFEFLLEALAILSRSEPSCYQLTIAGQGPEMERLKMRARQLQIDSCVHFAGSLQEREIAKVYRNSDLFVLATLREEGFPLVIAEALASGLPVITTNVGGNPTAVRNGLDGYLVEAGSAGALASAIERLAHDTQLRFQMAQNARERALNELDSKFIGRSIEEILKAAVRISSG
ncbi:glycosyltransferase family 4 protein [Acidobacteria bacterium AH-259-O06]|nr:glycosyltransferase family 4 protein [Acidobacteria bacterium AH-259-O06]